MKKLLLIFLLSSISAFCQHSEKVQGEISTNDTARLSILSIYPNKFPNVSVVFRAEKNNGTPVFGLGLNDMKVLENGLPCKVISLSELSKKKAINIGLVLDHSGSMLYDEKQMIELGIDPWYLMPDENGFPIFPDAYHAPIDVAKTALNSFVSTFNFDKDKISVIGFSSQVDKVMKLTNNEKNIKSMINSMEADSMTAFYDALIVGIKQLKSSDGLNVLVALTDGNDNMSKKNYKDVISLAKKMAIPIYIIGLGDVNEDSLRKLAEATDGQFFYANSASSLTEIYKKISVKLQAFYDMVYVSPNLSADAGNRKLEITFLKDGIHLISEDERFKLSKEIISYLKEKEAEKEQEYMVYGGIGILVLVTGGLTFYFTKRKKNTELKISKLYPNPSIGMVTIEMENNILQDGKLSINDEKGQQVKEIPFINGTEIDLTELPNGLYFLKAEFDGNFSESKKLLIQK